MTTTPPTKRLIIIDCDPGVDDAHAIMMALSRPEVQLLAITVVRGNCGVEQGCLNALKVLKVCNEMKVPVYQGAHCALLGDDFSTQPAIAIHGSDGLGDVSDSDTPDAGLIQQEHAAQAIVNLVKQNRGNVTLVAIGPLTNIALATRLFPQLGTFLKETIIMGGTIEGKGNTTAAAEFNFSTDPEAAHIVLNNLGGLIRLLSWETTGLQEEHLFDWEWFDKWLSSTTDKGRFLKSITVNNGKFKRDILKKPKYNSCDPVAMAVAIDSAVIKDQSIYYCDVELRGKITRGQMVVDWSNSAVDKCPNVHIVTKLDTELIKMMLEQAVN